MKRRCFLLIFIFLLSACSFMGPQSTATRPSTTTTLPDTLATPTTSSKAAATEITGPSGLTIEVYALTGPPSTEPLTFIPILGTQSQILLNHQALRDHDPILRLEQADASLRPFGYQIETSPTADLSTANTYTVTKDGVSLFQQGISGFFPVSVNADGTEFLMVVDAADGGYLISPQGVQKGGMGLGFPPPVFLGNDVLTAQEVYTDTANGSSGQVNVNLGSREVFTTAIGMPSPVSALRGLWSDGTNWLLEVARARGNTDAFQVMGEIYLNGISLNQKFGYQATFEYQLLGDKTFYFYQKNYQIGISYDNQVLPLGFDEIPHYGCCSGAELNPRKYASLIDFFARKGQSWYFVEAFIK
jgi:hypothetical protein